jgi:hypothetical protein
MLKFLLVPLLAVSGFLGSAIAPKVVHKDNYQLPVHKVVVAAPAILGEDIILPIASSTAPVKPKVVKESSKPVNQPQSTTIQPVISQPTEADLQRITQENIKKTEQEYQAQLAAERQRLAEAEAARLAQTAAEAAHQQALQADYERNQKIQEYTTYCVDEVSAMKLSIVTTQQDYAAKIDALEHSARGDTYSVIKGQENALLTEMYKKVNALRLEIQKRELLCPAKAEALGL